MRYRIFSENEWVYPDSDIDGACATELHSPRGGDVCLQVLTDKILRGEERFSFELKGLECTAEAYQLLEATVSENSGPQLFTTSDYDSVRDFVTRRAPFSVYDVTMPLDRGVLREGRAAFFFRLNVAAGAEPGRYDGSIVIDVDGDRAEAAVSLTVHGVTVPPLAEASFHMVNWIYYPLLAEQFGVQPYSEEYREILDKFFENQLDMRNDHLMIPAGEPVCDEEGRVMDFDFSHAAYVGNMALEFGFQRIMGGFVARFKSWDDADNYLLWDRETGCTTIEGYRQLKLYFDRAWECVVKNGWQERYMQCLVDEPQFPNSLAYRALSCICRSRMPGVKINDPVETTDIAGACDVWVVKQAVYEKHYADFRRLQEMGEEMWIYTCGFPAGATMNRVMDLPLVVSRLPMWLCSSYGCPGFLHWGYHAYAPSVGGDGCMPIEGGKMYPPGNAHIVYIGDGRPWYSVRGHLQRLGVQDYELLELLRKRDGAKASELIGKLCRSFDDYDGSAAAFDETRRELLEELG